MGSIQAGPALAALVACALALAGCGAGGALPAAGGSAPGPSGVAAAAPCTLPPLPGSVVPGPAGTALQGGAARSAFALDGGDLRVEPPAAGQRPAVPRLQAECEALAALGANGGALYQAAEQGGVAVGYGRVSVAPSVVSAPPPNTGYATIEVNGTSSTARMPAPAAFRGRLAWVVAVRQEIVASCPAMFGPAPARAPAQQSFGYEVFLLGAQSGAHALLYAESQPEPCGGRGSIPPSAFVPVDQVSVPWRFVSRSPDGYAGEIRAMVPPCAAYPGVVDVGRDPPAARVLVRQPAGAACGAPRPVAIALHAATVTSDLPAHVAHDPVGLFVPAPARSAPVSAVSTGRIETLGPQDTGRTVSVPVGTVLVVTPFPGMVQAGANPTVSSDPAVLGLLDGQGGPVAEFRAWKAGTADLTIPASACAAPGTGAPPCSGPWVVHVRVT